VIVAALTIPHQEKKPLHKDNILDSARRQGESWVVGHFDFSYAPPVNFIMDFIPHASNGKMLTFDHFMFGRKC
jgi:hypothetical protein